MKPTVAAHKSNFEALQLAFMQGKLALVERTIKATGEKVAVISAIKSISGNKVQAVPLAMFFNDNPHDILL